MAAHHRSLLIYAAPTIVAMFSCSGPDSGGNSIENGSSEGSSADGGLSGSGDPGGGSGPLGGDLGGGANPTPPNGGNLTADAACAATVLEPEAIETEETIERRLDCTADAPGPIALYIVLDNSGSMDDSNKWEDAVDAISDFVETDPATGTGWSCVDQEGNDAPPPPDLAPPGAGSISVAIQYFHPQGVGGNADECDGSGHSTPAVSMAPLPGNANNIVSSLNGTGPGGNTPTVGALTGGTEFCADYQQTNPDVQCVVVLVTDGQPNGCGLDSDCPGGGNDCVDPNAAAVLTPISGNAFNAPNSVMTFTIGMDGVTPEGFDLLDAIAAAGGSDCTPGGPGSEACNVSSGGGQGFLDALNTIRDTVQVTETSDETITTTVTQTTTLPCEWVIPEPPPGESFDKDLVNVTVSTASGVQRLGNVATEADCASDGGWYYDSADDPTRILACPGTCNIIETLTDATVQVLLGCITEPAVPH